jgi:drug/metabolite transporter (DMT)-like permease
MWIILAFLSAFLLGFYDVFKKKSLNGNAVIPVLLLNTLISSLIFLPLILLSACNIISSGTLFHVESYCWEKHLFIMMKSIIVLCSWIFGYFGIKNLPITIVGPINATRPVMVLIGALLLFGERLNLWQWSGVMIAMLGLFLLSHSGKKEGINFSNNKWIVFVFLSNILGAISGLYDKYLMASPENGGIGLEKLTVQSWFNIYQLLLMTIILFVLWWPKRKSTTPFEWRWSIILISLFLSAADFVYFYSLSIDGAMISIVSMIRRGSVVVSFLCGAFLFKEKNLMSKIIDLGLVILSMIFLFVGSR